MSAHTPTPWRVWTAHDGSVNIVGPGNEYVALVGRPGSEDTERIRADANRIVNAVNSASVEDREPMSETTQRPQNMMDALLKERDRCRDLLKQYEAIGPEGTFGATVIRQGLDRATEAIGSGDLVAIVRSYAELREFR